MYICIILYALACSFKIYYIRFIYVFSFHRFSFGFIFLILCLLCRLLMVVLALRAVLLVNIVMYICVIVIAMLMHLLVSNFYLNSIPFDFIRIHSILFSLPNSYQYILYWNAESNNKTTHSRIYVYVQHKLFYI